MNNFKEYFILKPTCSSCGRGIKIIGKKQNVSKRPGVLVQKYISKPHLLRGFKYDMRLYVLVTCFEPLKAYIFEHGLVRLATVPYSTAKSNLKKRFIHLTNFSVNKKNTTYKKNTGGFDKPEEEKKQKEDEKDEVSSKWSLAQLKAEYQSNGIDFAEVFKSIKSLCVKTLMAVEPNITTAMRSTKYRN